MTLEALDLHHSGKSWSLTIVLQFSAPWSWAARLSANSKVPSDSTQVLVWASCTTDYHGSVVRVSDARIDGSDQRKRLRQRYYLSLLAYPSAGEQHCNGCTSRFTTSGR